MCELQKLNNFCIFIMLLQHCFDLKKKKVFLTLIHNLSAGWNSSAQNPELKSKQQQKQCLPGTSSQKKLGKPEGWEQGQVSFFFFFPTFLFQSPFNYISLPFAK